MNLKNFLFGSFLILSLTATTAWANSVSYKWLDDDGNIVYSQTPPRDRQYDTIRTKSSSGSSSSRSSGSESAAVKSLEEGAAAREEKEKEAQKEVDLEKKRAAECEKAKKNVETFTIYRRVQKPDGSVVRLDDKERARLLKQAQDDVENFCN